MRRVPGLRLVVLLAASTVAVLALLYVSGVAPVEAFRGMAHGAFGSPDAWRGTLRQTMPLLFTGLSVFLGLRAGLFNIGVEGQLIVGALAAAVVALSLPGPLGLMGGAIAGMAAGALWTLPAGWIKAYRGGHEVITTIMLNNIASLLTAYLVGGPLKAAGSQMPTTGTIEATSRLPSLLLLQPRDGGSQWRLGSADDPAMREIGRVVFEMSLGIPLGVVLIAVLAYWLYRSVAGYELRAVGANARAAEFAGVDARRVTVRSLAVSGALAGLGGALTAMGPEGRFFAGFSPGYGFDGLGVAILAGSNPWGIAPAALLFGALNKGALSVQILDVPKGITGVILGVLIIAFAAARVRQRKVEA